jgi:SAM-dependent methyltransferase
MDPEALKKRVADYEWWQTIDLGGGVQTPGNPAVRIVNDRVLEVLRQVPMAGKTVLEIGCRDGLFCFEAERLGAREVTGIDIALSKGAQELLIPALQSKLKMLELNMLELTPEKFGKFDVIVFAGVLYHLRYPMWALRIIRDMLVDGGTLILETACFVSDDPSPLLYCPIEGDSPYEPTSVTFFNERGLRDTLRSLGFAVDSFEWAVDPPAASKGSSLKRGALQVARGLTQMLGGLGLQSSLLDAQVNEKVNTRLDRKVIYRGIVRCALARTADASVTAYWERVPETHVAFVRK